MKTNKREQQRNKLAEMVCRELRYQICKYPNGNLDWDTLGSYLCDWVSIGLKNKYTRPSIKELKEI